MPFLSDIFYVLSQNKHQLFPGFIFLIKTEKFRLCILSFVYASIHNKGNLPSVSVQHELHYRLTIPLCVC